MNQGSEATTLQNDPIHRKTHSTTMPTSTSPQQPPLVSSTTETMTGTTCTDNDMEYCKELSRRAVARAALHLGIDSISGDALNVLGDVLISYLERVGRVMANNVEASKRSTAHANILDAMHATEVCTASAAIQHQNTIDSSSNLHIGWESLATFMFGKDWAVDNVKANTTLSAIDQANNGTNGLNLNNNSITTSTKDDNTSKENEYGGWNAPFYEYVPDFPLQASHQSNAERSFVFLNIAKEVEACRSGHPSQTLGKVKESNVSKEINNSPGEAKTSTQLAIDAANKEVSNLSDDLFYRNGITSFWGTSDTDDTGRSSNTANKNFEEVGTSAAKNGLAIAESKASGAESSSKKRKGNTSSGNNKKLKSEDSPDGNKNRSDTSTTKQYNSIRPGFLPSFAPNFPPEHTYRLFRHEPEANLRNDNVSQPLVFDENDAKSVRRAIVSLERSVGSNLWGSEWTTDHHGAKKGNHSLMVPTSISSSVEDTTRTQTKGAVIEPLARQSSVRVSRILEGSLDIAS